MPGETVRTELTDGGTAGGWATLQVATRHWGTRPFHYRAGTSDEAVLRQIFVQRDYDISRLARAGDLLAVYHGMLAAARVPLIIDAGANIGASTLYLADCWPAAHVVAIEPDVANQTLLHGNTGHLPRVDRLHAALAAQSGELLLVDPGQGHWGLRALPADAVSAGARVLARVPAVGMAELLGHYPSPLMPFLCKIDIEGGERDLFADRTGWIDCFPLLVIELHDWLLPRQSVSRHFLREMAVRDRDFVYRGENVFSIANRFDAVYASPA